jgi:hypothetical protein
MSADAVDDLHAAEDLAVQADPDYCRPSCIDNTYYGGCEDEAECGCPCHDRETACVVCDQLGYSGVQG